MNSDFVNKKKIRKSFFLANKYLLYKTKMDLQLYEKFMNACCVMLSGKSKRMYI